MEYPYPVDEVSVQRSFLSRVHHFAHSEGWGKGWVGRCPACSGLTAMHFEPCMTENHLHIDARMADYIRTHPYSQISNHAYTPAINEACTHGR